MRQSRRIALSCVLALLAGCAVLDPYRRPDAWHPSGANQANLAAMVADPRDLAHGQSAQGTDAEAPVLAIDRIRQDKPKRLPVTSGITTGVMGSGSAIGGNGGASAAAYGY
ncbi:CpaD family pilus assembly lipoprotein [Gluconacetobacter sacchari]|uniref:Lipoprotein n=2 Tax=Gluconacetobacter sacchari TaxID=92759 RepID=A0A7W4IDH5_9PROT|nr:CpaD family pilus assembly lipoprotein [Gluconacetobacter sacchari]MBB2160838.1 hypothetical protein [Gluconacetobacter sacchari]GBQ28771.1 hypothetical protein AA12717_3051 [Gluconacetobacter sacchari DSM 12717]